MRIRARADRATVAPGPQAARTASFDLGPGSWTIAVLVDDDPGCPDVAADAGCSTAVEVKEPGGRMVPDDTNGDGLLDISDALAILGRLFLGTSLRSRTAWRGASELSGSILLEYSDRACISMIPGKPSGPWVVLSMGRSS